MKQFLFVTCILFFKNNFAAIITGNITDAKGNKLAHASIMVKGTGIGTTANANAEYSLNIKNGSYTIVCQHVGYTTTEKNITINDKNEMLNFTLAEQQYSMQDVTVGNGEDPAYEIIRNAIKTREQHLYEIKKYETDVYAKGHIQLRDYPKKFFGEKVDFEDGDSSKRKMIFLSEAVAKYYVDGKENKKIDVISTRISGMSDGFGLASPQIISFYENIISVGSGLNPRGFISPISNNALHYYKYKMMGSYFENGKEINRIKVIPKREYEPLFSGYINIIQNEWRVHSVDLNLLKKYQLQFLDTLNIQQLYVTNQNNWVIKQQVIHPAGKFFGFDFFGNIVQVYDNFNPNPVFKKDLFDNVVIKFADSSNKKSKQYWDSVRPIPLLDVEAKDYTKKDSIEIAHKDPKYLDSIDRKNNKISLSSLLFFGKRFNNEKKKSSLYIEPLISTLQFNTVEGLVTNLTINYNKQFTNKNRMTIAPTFRYGFSNTHFNPSVNFYYNIHKKYNTWLNASIGSAVFQFDNNNPISAIDNTFSTLSWKNNYMKIYEAKFCKIDFSKALNNGLTLQTTLDYQDRIPLENTTNYTWTKKYDDRVYTPNYPANFTQINEHKALSIGASITWKPGTKYLEIPDRRISLGSKYPSFNFTFIQGIPNVLGSNVDYSKWAFTVSDNLNLKLGGRIDYKLKAAGFAHATSAAIPDMQHVLGNQIAVASNHLNSFQLMPYYSFSNTARLYLESHLEYHLNGLLTNKIPLLKKWNWFFVVGANALYVNDDKAGYYEALFGIENIFKIFRVDFVKAFDSYKTTAATGIKISAPLFDRNRRR